MAANAPVPIANAPIANASVNKKWFEQKLSTIDKGENLTADDFTNVDQELEGKFNKSTNPYFIFTINGDTFAYVIGTDMAPGYKIKLQKATGIDTWFLSSTFKYPIDSKNRQSGDGNEFKKHIGNYLKIKNKQTENPNKLKEFLFIDVIDKREARANLTHVYTIANGAKPLLLLHENKDDITKFLKEILFTQIGKNYSFNTGSNQVLFLGYELKNGNLCVFENNNWRLATQVEIDNTKNFIDAIKSGSTSDYYFTFKRIDKTITKAAPIGSESNKIANRLVLKPAPEPAPTVGGTRYKRKQRKHRKTRKA